VVFPDSL